MPEYKLTYFDGKGRGEKIRMMFAHAGKKYTDNRISFEQWPKLKPTTPLGQLPVMEIDGGKVTLCQGLAIARYIARETGLAGGNSLEQAQVDMVAETMEEAMTKKGGIIFEKDPEKKAALEKTFNEELIPRVMTFVEKTICSNACQKGFIVGGSVTLADFSVWHIVDYLVKEDPKFLDAYPKMKANREKMASLTKFMEYVKGRPESFF